MKWKVDLRKENNKFIASLIDTISGEKLEVNAKTPEKCAEKIAPYVVFLNELKCGGADEITLDELKELVA